MSALAPYPILFHLQDLNNDISCILSKQLAYLHSLLIPVKELRQRLSSNPRTNIGTWLSMLLRQRF